MGGSILFTQNGTFKPNVYNLTTGKRINYIAIGGGGGAAAGYWAYYTPRNQYNVPYVSGGTYGGATSIGTYVTAPGAKPSVERHIAKIITYNSDSDSSWAVPTYAYGGCGEAGWIPGKIFQGYTGVGRPSTEKDASGEGTGTIAGLDIHSAKVNGGTLYSIGDTSVTSSVIPALAMTVIPDAQGGTGSMLTNPLHVDSDGSRTYGYSDGMGYGAGGGGVSVFTETQKTRIVAGCGGYAGSYKEGSFELTSTANIPITIGQGGTPHTSTTTVYDSSTYDLYYYSGHPGIPGAVMLWWD